MRLRFVVGLVAVVSVETLGCGATNFEGRAVHIEQHPYAFRGHALEYFVGVPEAPDLASLPLVVFVEGDGDACQEYRETLWRSFLTRFTGGYLLARPRTYVNTICGTEAFAAADFDHRVEELDVVVSDARTQYPGRRVYLVGHSAGAHVSLGLAERNPSRIAGIVNLGGGVRSLSEILPEIQREKARRGQISPAERDAELATLRDITADVEAHASSDAPFWGRSYRFWHSMFFGDLLSRWLRFPGPVLIAHGTEDLESVPWSSVRDAVRAFPPEPHDRVRFVFYEGLGHDLLRPVVMRDVARWIAEREMSPR